MTTKKQHELIKHCLAHRGLFFELKEGRKAEDTIIPIGIYKFGCIISRINKFRKAQKTDFDILELMTFSRNELRKTGMYLSDTPRYY